MDLVIAVLAHGEATHVDEATKERIRQAFARTKDFYREGGRSIAILFMAGVGRTASTRTLAERMALYAREYIEKEKLDERMFRLHYNKHDMAVWSTLEEMCWAESEAHKLYAKPYIEYVTNSRHGERVKFTAFLLGKSDPYVIESHDPPPPILHEAAAYLKLLTYRLAPPVYRLAQFVRRTAYSGG